MKGVGQFLEDRGIKKSNVGKAFLYYNGLLFVEWAAILGLCSKFQPIRRVYQCPFGQEARIRIISWVGCRYPRIENWVWRNADKLSQSRILSPVPRMFGVSSKHFTYSLAETIFLYNLTLPIWFQLNLIFLYNYFSEKDKQDMHSKSLVDSTLQVTKIMSQT